MKYFISDIHLKHKNILKFTRRLEKEGVEDLESMVDVLVDEWNSVVKPGDTVYDLGDSNFGKPHHYIEFLKRVNGNVIKLKGNHCSSSAMKRYQEETTAHIVDSPYYECSEGKQKIILCHYMLACWNREHHGAWHLFGHCLSMDHEVLTVEGWKSYESLSENDRVYSLNINSNTPEIVDMQAVIHYPNYTGKMYQLNSPCIKFNTTDEHTFIGKCRNNSNNIMEISGDDLAERNRFSFFRSLNYDRVGLKLSDELIRLYVYCSADGSFKPETKLWRIRVKKDHKKEAVENTLNNLNIEYKIYSKDGYNSYNFYKPFELDGFNEKGLDTKLLEMNRDQLKVFLEAYSVSDGNKTPSGGYMVYTSKKEEVDLISHICTINGFACNENHRFQHGFSKDFSYELSISDNTQVEITNISEKIVLNEVINVPVWCIRNVNGNFFTRYKGKVHLTGNCHNTMPDEHIHGKSMDVGLDALWENYGMFRPIAFDEIKEIMDNRVIEPIDGHKKRKGE